MDKKEKNKSEIKKLTTNEILKLARESRKLCKKKITDDEIERAINTGRP